jgi:hypothetical protein
MPKKSRSFYNVFYIYLTPCIPLSYQGEGEEKERGATAPLGRLLPFG